MHLGIVFAAAVTVAEQPNSCVTLSATVGTDKGGEARHTGARSAALCFLFCFFSCSRAECLFSAQRVPAVTVFLWPCDPEQFFPAVGVDASLLRVAPAHIFEMTA